MEYVREIIIKDDLEKIINALYDDIDVGLVTEEDLKNLNELLKLLLISCENEFEVKDSIKTKWFLYEDELYDVAKRNKIKKPIYGSDVKPILYLMQEIGLQYIINKDGDKEWVIFS